MNVREQLQARLNDEETYATTLLVILLDLYGAKATRWTPETVAAELADDLGVTLPRGNVDRLFCGIGILTSNDFFKRLPVFAQYCNVLSGNDFRPEIVEPPDAVECGWGILEGLLISPPDEDEPFTDEIRYFVGAICQAEGLLDPPDVLRIALFEKGVANYGGMSATEPSAFQAQFEDQAKHRQEIVETLHEETKALFQQLESLPLKNGRVKGLLDRLQDGGWRG